MRRPVAVPRSGTERYSGKHRASGGNVHALMRPDGLPVWVSEVVPGHPHDMSCARGAGLLGALYWAASQLGLPALASPRMSPSEPGTPWRSC